jgi:hypothetical protein
MGGLPILCRSECPFLADAVEKVLRVLPNSDSADSEVYDLGGSDDGSTERRSGKSFL